MSNPEYRIVCLADFLAVPAEKQADCLRDFNTWLNMARGHGDISAGLSELLGGEITFSRDSFIWIDDGLAEPQAFELQDVASGRAVRVSLKGDPA